MSSPFDQSRYQVRFEWGLAGLERLAASDIVVVVDVLSFSSTAIARVAAGEDVPGDAEASADGHEGAEVAARAAQAVAAPVVMLGALRNAAAVATAVRAEQQRRGARTSVAVIACGQRSAPGDSTPRFAVEDLLGAGAVIDALGALGLDHTSPEAAAACESFRGLRGAVRHLLTASGTGQELLARGAREDVLAAAASDDLTAVPVWRGGVFVAG